MLGELHDELLALVLGLLPPRDVEAAAVASRAVAFRVLVRFPIWRELFRRRWNALNYPLDPTRPLCVDARLRRLLPSDCPDSRVFQLLAHAIEPVPSFADLEATTQARVFGGWGHRVEALRPTDEAPLPPPRRRVVDFAYSGQLLGGDRAVRANVPFPTHPRVVVVATTNAYVIGLAAGAYFEISIRRRRLGPCRRLSASDMTSIGVANSRFRLMDRQPGWDRDSVGYHGDDGRLFCGQSRGRPFATPFGPGDTVGCGIRRDPAARRTFIYFTNNGELIPNGDRDVEGEHAPLFPIVGLDSQDAIHVNYGQEPFLYDDAGDAILGECQDQSAQVLASALQWHDITDWDADETLTDDDDVGERPSSPEEEEEEHDDDDGEDDVADFLDLVYEEFGDFVDDYSDEDEEWEDDDDDGGGDDVRMPEEMDDEIAA